MSSGSVLVEKLRSFDRRTWLIFEVSVILSWMLTPALGPFVADFFCGPEKASGLARTLGAYEKTQLVYIVTTVPAVALILFLIWISGDRFEEHGFRRMSIARQVAAFIAACGLIAGTYFLFRAEFVTRPIHVDLHPLIILVFAIRTICFAVHSAIFFQAYLTTRLEEILGSVWPAIIGSALFSGIRFSHTSWLEAGFEFSCTLLIGLVFVVNRSIWPLIAASSTTLVFLYFVAPVSLR